MKYFIDEKTGSVVWRNGEDLLFAPIGTDNTFDTNDAGQVDFGQIEEEESARLKKIAANLAIRD